jgi:hypothetical protein
MTRQLDDDELAELANDPELALTCNLADIVRRLCAVVCC